MAPMLRPRQPELSHGQHRLYRWPPPLGLSRRSPGTALPLASTGTGAASRAGVGVSIGHAAASLALCLPLAALAAEWVKVPTPDLNRHWYDRTKLAVENENI